MEKTHRALAAIDFPFTFNNQSPQGLFFLLQATHSSLWSQWALKSDALNELRNDRIELNRDLPQFYEKLL